LGAFKAGTAKLRGLQWIDDHRLLVTTSTVYTASVLSKTVCDVGIARGRGPALDGTGKTAGAGYAEAGLGSFNPILCMQKKLPLTREWTQLQMYDTTNHQLSPIPDLSKFKEVRVMNVIGGHPMLRVVNGRAVLIFSGLYVRPGTGLGGGSESSDSLLPLLIQVDLESGIETILRRGDRESQQWFTAADGSVAIEEELADRSLRGERHWTLRLSRKGVDDVIINLPGETSPRPLAFGTSADTLLMQMNGDDMPVLRTLSLRDGSLTPLPASTDAPTAPIVTPATDQIIGVNEISDDSRYVFFDAALQVHWDQAVRTLRAAHLKLSALSADLSKAVVRVEGSEAGFRYVWIDLMTLKSDAIANVYPGVATPLEVRRFTYAATDGLEISAYLTLPSGRPAKDLALIVLPHGDPAKVDTMDFDWWSQGLADQGYAVLRANYRGSGLTEAFHAAGFGQLGRKMQSDLSDGVRHLVKEGIVDRARVCIVGARYGGYAALAGAALEHDTYRCAIAVDGFFDLARIQQSAGQHEQLSGLSLDSDLMARFMGDRGTGVQALSPLEQVAAIHIPVLLFATENDSAVAIQSQLMHGALRKAGKPVDLITLPQETQLLESAEARLMLLEKSVEFLKAHNAPD
jgi:dipeptidyl aminopeptidase/acylaminoacyl peptidase